MPPPQPSACSCWVWCLPLWVSGEVSLPACLPERGGLAQEWPVPVAADSLKLH